MSVSRLLFFLLLPFALLASLPSYGSSAAPSLCPRLALSQVADDLRSQSPSWIEHSLPEEVHSDALETLARAGGSAYISILFYASGCPFSQKIRPTYDALTSMFPQMRHFTVEESSTMPSVLSRHGIHSFPTILLANRTAIIRYHGPKDLNLLTHFYRQTTGQEPFAYFHVGQTKERIKLDQPWLAAASEILKADLYLTFSLLFVLLRTFIGLFPKFIHQLKVLWMSYALRHVNLGILRESRQLLGRILHAIDIKRAWSKLRRSNKTRNFHKGAKNARVWASSLASVSLGDSSKRTQAY